MSCPHHDLCAYTGTEPDRCPTCHTLWNTIVQRYPRDPASHSCETRSIHAGRHLTKDEVTDLIKTARNNRLTWTKTNENN